MYVCMYVMRASQRELEGAKNRSELSFKELEPISFHLLVWDHVDLLRQKGQRMSCCMIPRYLNVKEQIFPFILVQTKVMNAKIKENRH